MESVLSELKLTASMDIPF